MSALQQTTARPVRDRVHYPDSDGKPMGETPAHIRNMRWATEPIEQWFADDPNVFVAADIFVYYVEGKPQKHVSPDLLVVKGIPKVTEPDRRKYQTWRENGKGPDLVIEFTSASTRHKDTVTKKEIYRAILKVSEYFLFDPHNEYLRPAFRAIGSRKAATGPSSGSTDACPARAWGCTSKPTGRCCGSSIQQRASVCGSRRNQSVKPRKLRPRSCAPRRPNDRVRPRNCAPTPPRLRSRGCSA